VEILDTDDEEDDNRPCKSLSSKVSHILEPANNTDDLDDDDDDLPDLTKACDEDSDDEDMEEPEESAEEELSKFSCNIRRIVYLQNNRTPDEGMDLAYLRVLQAYTHHRVH